MMLQTVLSQDGTAAPAVAVACGESLSVGTEMDIQHDSSRPLLQQQQQAQSLEHSIEQQLTHEEQQGTRYDMQDNHEKDANRTYQQGEDGVKEEGAMQQEQQRDSQGEITDLNGRTVPQQQLGHQATACPGTGSSNRSTVGNTLKTEEGGREASSEHSQHQHASQSAAAYSSTTTPATSTPPGGFGGALIEAEAGHIYRPGTKAEVRLVYRIKKGLGAGRHQKSYSISEFIREWAQAAFASVTRRVRHAATQQRYGLEGAWEQAEAARQYINAHGHLPPYFAVSVAPSAKSGTAGSSLKSRNGAGGLGTVAPAPRGAAILPVAGDALTRNTSVTDGPGGGGGIVGAGSQGQTPQSSGVQDVCSAGGIQETCVDVTSLGNFPIARPAVLQQLQALQKKRRAGAARRGRPAKDSTAAAAAATASVVPASSAGGLDSASGVGSAPAHSTVVVTRQQQQQLPLQQKEGDKTTETSVAVRPPQGFLQTAETSALGGTSNTASTTTAALLAAASVPLSPTPLVSNGSSSGGGGGLSITNNGHSSSHQFFSSSLAAGLAAAAGAERAAAALRVAVAARGGGGGGGGGGDVNGFGGVSTAGAANAGAAAAAAGNTYASPLFLMTAAGLGAAADFAAVGAAAAAAGAASFSNGDGTGIASAATPGAAVTNENGGEGIAVAITPPGSGSSTVTCTNQMSGFLPPSYLQHYRGVSESQQHQQSITGTAATGGAGGGAEVAAAGILLGDVGCGIQNDEGSACTTSTSVPFTTEAGGGSISGEKRLGLFLQLAKSAGTGGVPLLPASAAGGTDSSNRVMHIDKRPHQEGTREGVAKHETKTFTCPTVAVVPPEAATAAVTGTSETAGSGGSTTTSVLQSTTASHKTSPALMWQSGSGGGSGGARSNNTAAARAALYGQRLSLPSGAIRKDVLGLCSAAAGTAGNNAFEAGGLSIVHRSSCGSTSSPSACSSNSGGETLRSATVGESVPSTSSGGLVETPSVSPQSGCSSISSSTTAGGSSSPDETEVGDGHLGRCSSSSTNSNGSLALPREGPAIVLSVPTTQDDDRTAVATAAAVEESAETEGFGWPSSVQPADLHPGEEGAATVGLEDMCHHHQELCFTRSGEKSMCSCSKHDCFAMQRCGVASPFLHMALGCAAAETGAAGAAAAAEAAAAREDCSPAVAAATLGRHLSLDPQELPCHSRRNRNVAPWLLPLLHEADGDSTRFSLGPAHAAPPNLAALHMPPAASGNNTLHVPAVGDKHYRGGGRKAGEASPDYESALLSMAMRSPALSPLGSPYSAFTAAPASLLAEQQEASFWGSSAAAGQQQLENAARGALAARLFAVLRGPGSRSSSPLLRSPCLSPSIDAAGTPASAVPSFTRGLLPTSSCASSSLSNYSAATNGGNMGRFISCDHGNRRRRMRGETSRLQGGSNSSCLSRNSSCCEEGSNTSTPWCGVHSSGGSCTGSGNSCLDISSGCISTGCCGSSSNTFNSNACMTACCCTCRHHHHRSPGAGGSGGGSEYIKRRCLDVSPLLFAAMSLRSPSSPSLLSPHITCFDGRGESPIKSFTGVGGPGERSAHRSNSSSFLMPPRPNCFFSSPLICAVSHGGRRNSDDRSTGTGGGGPGDSSCAVAAEHHHRSSSLIRLGGRCCMRGGPASSPAATALRPQPFSSMCASSFGDGRQKAFARGALGSPVSPPRNPHYSPGPASPAVSAYCWASSPSIFNHSRLGRSKSGIKGFSPGSALGVAGAGGGTDGSSTAESPASAAAAAAAAAVTAAMLNFSALPPPLRDTVSEDAADAENRQQVQEDEEEHHLRQQRGGGRLCSAIRPALCDEETGERSSWGKTEEQKRTGHSNSSNDENRGHAEESRHDNKEPSSIHSNNNTDAIVRGSTENEGRGKEAVVNTPDTAEQNNIVDECSIKAAKSLLGDKSAADEGLYERTRLLLSPILLPGRYDPELEAEAAAVAAREREAAAAAIRSGVSIFNASPSVVPTECPSSSGRRSRSPSQMEDGEGLLSPSKKACTEETAKRISRGVTDAAAAGGAKCADGGTVSNNSAVLYGDANAALTDMLLAGNTDSSNCSSPGASDNTAIENSADVAYHRGTSAAKESDGLVAADGGAGDVHANPDDSGSVAAAVVVGETPP